MTHLHSCVPSQVLIMVGALTLIVRPIGVLCFLENFCSWKSKKQATMFELSIKEGYRSIWTTCNEVVWLHHLFVDFGYHSSSLTPMYCDNGRAIKIFANFIYHELTKHIEIDYQFVQKKLTMVLLLFLIFPLEINWRIFLTKFQMKKRHEFFIGKLLIYHHQSGGIGGWVS